MTYAHSVNRSGLRHGLVVHLRSVAEAASAFATGLRAGQLAYYAGLWHDIGKFHSQFQDYLARCETNSRVRGHGPDHKAAGAEMAMRHFHALSLLVQGHHGGLQSPTLKDAWLSEKRRGVVLDESLALAKAAIPDLEPDDALIPPDFVLNDANAAELFLRLVFSALVDADFLDTERHFKNERAIQRGSAVSLADLWSLLQLSQEKLIRSASAGVVNEVRKVVHQNCVNAAQGRTGFYRLTVPTGGGKTRSAMAFALRHAQEHGLQRVIVGVPFISITEQTAAVYREIFALAGSDAVLEHHSMADWADEADGDFHREPVWDRLAAENWDAPVVVTTTVQIFESLFSNLPSRTRKLHRLARSVIILDEAQALPARLLKPILDVLRQLVEHYGTTVVLSTATQPAFDSIQLFSDVQATEIVPEPARLFDVMRRVEYEWLTDVPLTAAEVAARLTEQGHALAVLNTKKDPLAVVDALHSGSRATALWAGAWGENLQTALDEAPVLHLSTLLCGAHRHRLSKSSDAVWLKEPFAGSYRRRSSKPAWILISRSLCGRWHLWTRSSRLRAAATGRTNCLIPDE
jgi:CRISPR-associated endonuclease/helicase Cas3